MGKKYRKFGGNGSKWSNGKTVCVILGAGGGRGIAAAVNLS